MNFRDTPIRQKLMVVVMATTLAALLLAGAGILVLDSVLFRGYLGRDVSALAGIIVDNSTAALAFNDPASANETLAALRSRPHIVSACIFRPDGSVLAQYAGPQGNAQCAAPGSVTDIRFTSRDLIATRPVMLRGRQIGSFSMVYDLAEIGERRRIYGAGVLAVLALASLAAWLLSARLRAVISTPISRLALATTSVSQTKDYSIRAQKFSNDELGILVDAFNEMLAGIQSRDRDLRHALAAREEALGEARNARDSLQITLASIGDAVISTDTEGRIVFANRVALALLGLPAEDVQGRYLDEVFRIVNEYSRESVESPVAKVLREGTIVGMANHTVLLAHDGTEIPIDDSGAPIRREGGPVQGTVLVFRDVTARRKADETSRLLRSIVESSGDAIIAKDLNGIVTSWNRGAEAIFGYKAEEMIGRPISVLGAPGHEGEMDVILKRIRSGETIDHFQTVRRTKDGRLIHVSLTVSPLYDALGRIIGASKIARDITESVLASERLAQLNRELRASVAELARSNDDLERFAFVASHDLQEPLRMITVFSQLLVKRYADVLDDQVSAYVDNIVQGSERMRDLLADLLAYTALGSKPVESGEPVDLNELLESVLHDLKIAIEDSAAVIESDRLPTLHVHRAHFAPLFQNLVGNAIKYRSAAPPRIRISFGEEAGALRFAVSDNGIGIEPEYHQKIFVAFKRLHGRTIPGTGIGLAICQRVVERYGGRIWVESQSGQGSTFAFTLPATLRAEETGKSKAKSNEQGD